MVVPEVHTRAAMSLTNQGSGSKVSVFPRELLILSRLIPCSSWTEYSHAHVKKFENSPRRLRANSVHVSRDPDLPCDGNRTLPSDIS